ncbi:MAG: pseudouridine-5'-phosphate glycosidase [Saprospiraceae bacterium]|nr:pseudouridine-5'-phosphate glycosidase [Lewinella sp.]
MTDSHPYLDLSEDILAARNDRKPIVALESTIISHGMPYPKNVETALEVEATVRKHGGVPATIAILNGRLKAGLSVEEIEQLGRAGTAITKVSRRDIPFVVARRHHGATTVAATMFIAHKAGIKVFGTGGIGGVHRDAPTTMDISADLPELAQTDVAVVSAGAKSILDLSLTLEYLETHGVPVIGYRTSEFPAFFTRQSGLEVNYRLDSPDAIAAAMRAKWEMGLSGGLLVANPIPEAAALDKKWIDVVIDQAISEAAGRGITGKEITPFLLSRIEHLSKGKSLEANIQLVLNNVVLATKIAKAYQQLLAE